MWIAKGQHAVARDHRGHRIGPFAAQMHGRNSLENHLGRQCAPTARRTLKLQRQYVEQHFTVAVGVDVACIELEQISLQLLAVGEVAVVHQRNTER